MILFFFIFAVYIEVHANSGKNFKEQFKFLVLLFFTNQSFVDGRLNGVRKHGIAHPLDHQGAIASRHESAGGEDHAMVEILYAEFGMQAVVDFCRESVNMFFVDVFHLEQGGVVGGVLQRVRAFAQVLLRSFENARFVAVIEDADDMLIFFLKDFDVLLQLAHMLFVQGKVGGLCFQN